MTPYARRLLARAILVLAFLYVLLAVLASAARAAVDPHHYVERENMPLVIQSFWGPCRLPPSPAGGGCNLDLSPCGSPNSDQATGSGSARARGRCFGAAQITRERLGAGTFPPHGEHHGRSD